MLRSMVSRCVWIPLLLASCSWSKGPDGPATPQTTRVGGVLKIDGQPAPVGEVELKLYSLGTPEKPGDVIANCVVGQGGRYEFNSYRQGDGAVPGEYVLSMEWLRPAPGVMYGPDRFLNNFNSPLNEDPRFAVSVIGGFPVEIPEIDIKMSELTEKPSHEYASPAGKPGNKKR